MTYATVPRLWDGETAVILASGPSLCADDVEHCRGKAKLIAVKDAIRLAPDADVLYACGADNSRWWERHGPTLTAFTGHRYTLDPRAGAWASVLQHTGETGLEIDPSGLRSGRNSAYQALNIAVHFGCRRILLLGLDMGHNGPKYFFGNRPVGEQRQSPFALCLTLFATLVEPLRALGVVVLNCSRVTALDIFPRVTLREALP